MEYRIEKDQLGEMNVPLDALYGIHALRAKENFPDTSDFKLNWFKATAQVKLASYLTYKSFKASAAKKFEVDKLGVKWIEDDVLEAMIKAAEELVAGKYFDAFIVPAISGGAGTSINMNVNEIIANRALQILGDKPGNYSKVHPIEHANIYQSTNDVIPTALKLAVMKELDRLEILINKFRAEAERLETEYRNTVRISYTQMQQAVPSSYGKLFSNYSEALSRDWWRVSKCFERIKVVNLGGSAVGTGMAVPRYFIMEATSVLQKLSNVPVTRSENLTDATSNLDSFVEVHATLKSHAVNLEKMVNDIRLLAADVIKDPEVTIPKQQVGSSIMPGKVNPVIPEFIVSVAHQIYANDILISNLSAQSCLDLNAYLPVIGNAILQSLELLQAANVSLTEKLFKGLIVDKEKASRNLYESPVITTALVPFIGYDKAAELAKHMKEKAQDVYQANKDLKILSEEKIKVYLSPENLLKLGYSLNDL